MCTSSGNTTAGRRANRLLRLETVANRIDTAASTLRAWCAAGKLGCAAQKTPGGEWRVADWWLEDTLAGRAPSCSPIPAGRKDTK